MGKRNKNRAKHRGKEGQESTSAQKTENLSRKLDRFPLWMWGAAGSVLFYLLINLVIFNPVPATGGDNAGYMILAESLTQGEYRDLYLPGEPPHVKYPPVFPLLLALIGGWGVPSWVAAKLLVIFSGGAAVLGAFFLARKATGSTAMALSSGILLSIAPAVMLHTQWVLSDIPFLALSLWTLWILLKLQGSENGLKLALVAGALASLATLTRSAGIALVLAGMLALLLGKRFKEFGAFTVPALLPYLAWTWRGTTLDAAYEYGGEFWYKNPYDPALGTIGPLDLPGRIIENMGIYITRIFPEFLTGSMEGMGGKALSVLLVLLALTWLAHNIWKRKAGILEVFTILYTGTLLVWPQVWATGRFLITLYPLILIATFQIVERVIRKRKSGSETAQASNRITIFATAGLSVLIALAAAPEFLRQQEQATICRISGLGSSGCLHQGWVDYFNMAEDSREAIEQGAYVYSRKPRHFYVASGLQGDMYPLTSDPREFLADARERDFDYLVLDQLTSLSQAYLVPVITRAPQYFCIDTRVPSTRTTIFLRILREPVQTEGLDAGQVSYCP